MDVAAETEAMARVEKEDRNVAIKQALSVLLVSSNNYLPMALIRESSLKKDFTNQDLGRYEGQR